MSNNLGCLGLFRVGGAQPNGRLGNGHDLPFVDRRIFANAIIDTLEDLEVALTEALRPYWQEPAKLQRLVGYPWWCGAMAGSNTNSTQPA